jgi:hypothetical protein
MQKQYKITEEEFEAIKEAISNTLNLWSYDIVVASDYDDTRSTSMNKETFFNTLKSEFIIK